MISKLRTDGAVKTVGVDLSATPSRTALVVAEWKSDSVEIQAPTVGLSDAELVARLADVEWSAFDAPFGWPQDMVNSVYRYMTSGSWESDDRESFRFRRTDRFIRDTVFAETGKKLWPMSVSSDRLALTARRMAQLRELLAAGSTVRFDRSGADRVVEVYPSAALVMWGIDPSGYKRSGNTLRHDVECKARGVLLSALEGQLPQLQWAQGSRDACVENDDVLDAVFGALIARIASLGQTLLPQGDDLDRARVEGWIHLPQRESLGKLFAGAKPAVVGSVSV